MSDKDKKRCLHYRHRKSSCSKTVLTTNEGDHVDCDNVFAWIPDKTKTQYLCVWLRTGYGIKGCLHTEIRSTPHVEFAMCMYCTTCKKAVGNVRRIDNFGHYQAGVIGKLMFQDYLNYKHYTDKHLPVTASPESSGQE